MLILVKEYLIWLKMYKKLFLNYKIMYKTDLLKDEQIKKDFKDWKLTNEEYINKLWKLYYKNGIIESIRIK